MSKLIVIFIFARLRRKGKSSTGEGGTDIKCNSPLMFNLVVMFYSLFI